jgi:hypothetical protein
MNPKKFHFLAILLALLGVFIGFTWAGYALRTTPLPSPTPIARPTTPFQPTQPAPPEGVVCTQEVRLCPDGSYVSRTGPKCEFTPCPQASPAVSKGYTLDSYDVAETTSVVCKQASDCVTPPEYLMQSHCPFTSLCLQDKCTVVCPKYVGNR